ncbi:caspase family protein [Desulfococcaceae bacterium HSG9]|nr:caspase family protein [Desulfococcaceae bacterium HSG9]
MTIARQHPSFNFKTAASVLLIGLLVFGCTAAALTSPAPEAATGTKYALLIGIQDYRGEKFKPLQGTLNDIELMRAILTDRFEFKPENIIILTDSKATHTAIKIQFEKLQARLKPGDMVYIHYSGHGSFTCDLNGDEGESLSQTQNSYRRARRFG